MKVVIQRVSQAQVVINDKIKGKIESGLLVLVGFCNDDDKSKVDWMCNKIVNLRVFADENDKMNLSVSEKNGGVLLISNFTLYGDSIKGNRPNFSAAAKPDIAIPLYNYMIEVLSQTNINIQTGEFGAMMDVSLTNDGPVTVIIEK